MKHGGVSLFLLAAMKKCGAMGLPVGRKFSGTLIRRATSQAHCLVNGFKMTDF